MAQTKDVTIYCVNTKEYKDVPVGSSLGEIYQLLKLTEPSIVTNAKVNNVVEDLNYLVFTNKDIEFLDISSETGIRTYGRSLFFVLSKAVKELFPGCSVSNETSVASGFYCRLIPDQEITEDCINQLNLKMKEIIDRDIPFIKVTTHTEDALKLFERYGYSSKIKLLKNRNLLYTTYYTLDGEPDYYYGPLLKSTGEIHAFELERFAKGLLVRMPDPHKPYELLPVIKQDKMLEVIREQREWQEIIGLSTIGDLNEFISKQEHITDIINVSEALQEKKITKIAENIQANQNIRLILIAGPSSSGKTTFSKRLSIQLVAAGIKPAIISMDDYFVDREKTPLDENGNYDFESIYALDIEKLQQDLQFLLNGEEIELSKFDFTIGKRVPSGKKMKIDKNTILVMEGIHGLNPELTKSIAPRNKYKIFVSALTTIQLDAHNFIPTSDNRLLRRIVRDYKYRKYTAQDTISRWPSVQKGENKWIVPYQEEADIMFNSALLFELAGLRTQALPLLEMVPENAPEYSEAKRLRKFLNYILPIKIDELPPTSLLREFMGGSSFHY